MRDVVSVEIKSALNMGTKKPAPNRSGLDTLIDANIKIHPVVGTIERHFGVVSP